MSSPEQAAVDAYTDVAERYDEFYCSNPRDLADSDIIFSRARRLAPKGGLFVDLGCGPGTALRWNVAPGALYIGIDPAAGCIATARRTWPRHVFYGGDHHGIPEGAAFVLGGFGPLMHVGDLDEFSRVLRKRLRRGGRFLLMASCHGVRVLDRDIFTYHWHAADLDAAFAWASPNIYGHRRFVPQGWPRWLQRWLLRLERLVCGYGLDPDRCDYLVVEGRKS